MIILFSIFKLFNSIELTEYEKAHLHNLLDGARKCADFTWLDQLDLDKICIKECPGMTGTDVVGAFTPLQPRTIYVQRFMQPSTEYRPFWLEFIFPIVIHELRHMLQFKKRPLLYCLCALPLIRTLTLERDAEKQTTLAEDFITEFSHVLDQNTEENVTK